MPRTLAIMTRHLMMVRQQGGAERVHTGTMETLQIQKEASQKGHRAGDSAVTYRE